MGPGPPIPLKARQLAYACFLSRKRIPSTHSPKPSAVFFHPWGVNPSFLPSGASFCPSRPSFSASGYDLELFGPHFHLLLCILAFWAFILLLGVDFRLFGLHFSLLGFHFGFVGHSFFQDARLGEPSLWLSRPSFSLLSLL